MKPLKEYKVEASSLAESVIAMVLVAVCLVVITSVLSSLLTNTAPVAFYEGRQAVKQWAQETRDQKLFTEDKRQGINYTITRMISRDMPQGYTVVFKLSSGQKNEERSYIMYE